MLENLVRAIRQKKEKGIQGEKEKGSQAWWLMRVISALWKAEVGRSQGQDQDHSGTHGETPSLPKIQSYIESVEASRCLKRPGVVAHACNPSTLGG